MHTGCALAPPGSKSTREKNTSNSKDVKGGRKLELGTWKVGGGRVGRETSNAHIGQRKGGGERGREEVGEGGRGRWAVDCPSLRRPEYEMA